MLVRWLTNTYLMKYLIPNLKTGLSRVVPATLEISNNHADALLCGMPCDGKLAHKHA
jgi:hypothetical protein